MNNGVMNALQSDWETPYEIIAWLDESFDFTVDLCASRSNALCGKYYTEKNSCLDHDWHGERCYINPPYGKAMYPMLEKCVSTWKEGDCCIVAVLPVRTDTRWFHDYILHHSTSISFIKGRVKFDRYGVRVNGSGNPVGQMVVTWESTNPGDWEKQTQLIESVDYKEIEQRYRRKV